MPETTRTTDESGIRWGEELFVGLSLAAAISAALLTARRRQRRRYRPGSGDRTDLAAPPVVYQLRLAHLCAQHDDGPARETSELHTAPASGTTAVLGVRDGRQIALDLATAHGLGLIGAGAAAAVRALVVSVLAATPQPARQNMRIVVPAADLATLHGQAPRELPTCLHVAADLNAALDALEAEILIRAGASKTMQGGWSPLLLVTHTPDRERQRLQAILDNGSPVGVTGLLLGQWPAGATAYVREDGTISTTNPGVGEALRGTRVFRIGVDDTADLLTLLHDAEPEPHHDPTGMGVGGRAHGVIRSDRGPADTGLEIVEDASTPRSGRRQALFSPPDRTTATTAPRPVPMRISVLGPPRVWLRATPTASDARSAEAVEREITAAFQPRVRELLAFLALNPDGATREALIAAVWPASPPEKTTNAMNTGLTRLRRAVAVATNGSVPDVVQTGDGRYRLDPDLVEVDYHRFAAAVAARRAATTDQERVDAYRRIVDSYTGPLADGLSTEWIETAREAIRRDAIDAVAALARALIEDDPQQTLDLLEIARAFDPHNELIYRDIMRLQERLGQFDAIPRTLTLLTKRLAEVDDQPTNQTIDLAERLRRRHEAPGGSPHVDRGHSRAG